MTKRRAFLMTALASGAWPFPAALAQGSSLMRVLVGFQPGGSSDMVGRVAARALQAALAQTVVVENRPGAGGRLAIDAMRNAKPNGETLVVAAQGAMTLFPYFYKNLGYDPLVDLTPVSRLVSFDYALTVGPGVPARNLAEYAQWAKANPDRASFASAGAGTTPHFIGIAFHRRIGVAAVHVPYKGTAPAIPDLVAGRIHAMFATLSDSLQLHRNGSVRIIATAGAERSPMVAEVPTFREQGTDLVVPGWMGLYGPRGMPTTLQDKFREALRAGLNTTEVRQQLLELGMSAATSSPAELAALQRGEHAFWGPVVKESGFVPET